MKNEGPVYVYDLRIVCAACGAVEERIVLSVNPHKTSMTFLAYNPLTGYGGLDSLQTLACGHTQDMEGAPVTPHHDA